MKGAARNPGGIRVAYGAATLVAGITIARIGQLATLLVQSAVMTAASEALNNTVTP